MRIRRKKHLEERLAGVKDYVIVPDMDIVNVKEAIKVKKYFDYQALFLNNNPIELEIGCGKGGFIVEKAIKNPNVNYIAVELLQNIIVMAAELAKSKGVKNLKFVNSGAEYLPRYIRENSIDNLYLNFSPPYPQKVHERRRLTCDRMLINYKSFLKQGGCIYQKTDDKDFFDYSFERFVENGFETKDVSLDIESGKIENVKTEYEKKFLALGMKVYALTAKLV